MTEVFERGDRLRVKSGNFYWGRHATQCREGDIHAVYSATPFQVCLMTALGADLGGFPPSVIVQHYDRLPDKDARLLVPEAKLAPKSSGALYEQGYRDGLLSARSALLSAQSPEQALATLSALIDSKNQDLWNTMALVQVLSPEAEALRLQLRAPFGAAVDSEGRVLFLRIPNAKNPTAPIEYDTGVMALLEEKARLEALPRVETIAAVGDHIVTRATKTRGKITAIETGAVYVVLTYNDYEIRYGEEEFDVFESEEDAKRETEEFAASDS